MEMLWFRHPVNMLAHVYSLFVMKTYSKYPQRAWKSITHEEKYGPKSTFPTFYGISHVQE